LLFKGFGKHLILSLFKGTDIFIVFFNGFCKINMAELTRKDYQGICRPLFRSSYWGSSFSISRFSYWWDLFLCVDSFIGGIFFPVGLIVRSSSTNHISSPSFSGFCEKLC